MPVLIPVESGVDVWSLVDVNGSPFTLSEAAGYLVSAGASGRWSAPVAFAEQATPGRPGVRVRQVNVEARPFELPITILGDTPTQVDARIKALQKFVYARKGPLWIRVTDREGNAREIRAYSTLELSEQPGSARAPTFQRVMLVNRCVDAFWRDQAVATATYDTGATPSPTLPFTFPFLLASSTVLATTTIDNSGDEDAEPVWTITGPGTNPVLRNLTTGQTLRLSTTIAVGRSIVIDTRSRIDRDSDWQIYDPLGANLFGDAVGIPSLWKLVPGANRIQVEMTDATSDSSVALEYRRQWHGP